MASAVASNPFFAAIHRNRGMVLPFAAIALLMVILIPLPPAVLDFLLVLNLTLSAIVLVTTIFVNSPLEFSVFPSLVVGVIIFIIIVVIQFVVITKGATRIAEVAARFTLDAMPGKQMAIDADLNDGV